MKKLLNSLPFRLLLGIVVGVLLGQVFPLGAMKVVVTLQYIMGQLITFCVPLIVIGFIAPSITRLGKNASRLLGVAIVIAYTSSVCAAFMSTGAGYALIPHLSIDTEVAGLRELPEVVFELNIPQIMSVMSALVLSVLVGLAATWTNSKLTCDLLGEFQNIVLSVVSKIIIPILPFYIAATFCNLSYEGMITHQLPAFIQIILIVMAGHYIWLAVLYLLAGAYSGKNPWECHPPLRPGLPHRRRHHVQRRDAGRCAGLRPQEQGAAQGYGQLRHPAVRKHPPLRLGADRGVLLHDHLEDPLR